VSEPAWVPGEAELEESNLARLIRDRGLGSYEELRAWASANRADFWEEMIGRLGIRLRTPPERVLDTSSAGVERARWLPGARLSIVESCLRAEPSSIALIHSTEGGALERMTVAELDDRSARVAAGLRALGLGPGDADRGRHADDRRSPSPSYLGIVRMPVARWCPSPTASRPRRSPGGCEIAEADGGRHRWTCSSRGGRSHRACTRRSCEARGARARS
jgi:hypothetical protein